MVTKPMTYGITSYTRADDILAWSKDIDDRTEFREGSACVSNCTSFNGVGGGNKRWGVVCGVGIIVPSSNLENLK
jgi:hypothetical protein